MLPIPVIAEVQFRSYEIMNLALILVPTFLFAVYKLVSRCLRHRVKKLKIEKGIVSTRSKSHGGAKWIRSIYTAIFLLLASGAFGAYWIICEGFGSPNPLSPLSLFGVLPFCAGIACLIRGILKRKSYLRKLALNNGMPFEVICPPQKHWVLPIAMGLPLLIYAGVVLAICIASNSGGVKLGISIIVAGILGGMFFLYGLLMCIVVSRNKAKAMAVVAEVPPTSHEAIADRQQDIEIV
jgi:hypothetical protein